MKKNELAEIKKIDSKTVKDRILKAQVDLKNLYLDKNMGKLANLKSMKNLRKSIAQMLTVLAQKQLLEKLEKETKNG